MACVYQRNGCWCVDYTDRRGVRIRRKISPVKREAQDILAANTGLRLGELQALTWDRVDLFARTIFVAHSKTGHSRSIPLNQSSRNALGSIPRRLGCPFVFVRVRWDGRTRPFTNILPTFKRACEQAGVTDCCWHTLRHTFASHLVTQGVELAVVRELLGHRPTSFRLTLRYAHLQPEKHQDAVGRLDGLGEGSGEMFGALSP